MKPFRKNLAIAIDGGGIRGVIVTRALAMLEAQLGTPLHELTRLTTGTSTGAIIAAGIGAGLSGSQMYGLYTQLGEVVFPKSWRTTFFPFFVRYKYSNEPLETALRLHIGDRLMVEFWNTDPPMDVVITAFDLIANRTRFIKPWKTQHAGWSVVKAVLASSAVPTYFPVVDGRYIDGGVGSYGNPSYIAAYELVHCLGWDPRETTLLSLGTGRDPHTLKTGEADRFYAWDWLEPVLDAFSVSAADQQVHLVKTFFPDLDFRRFQVDLQRPIAMDDIGAIAELTRYGDVMGRMILADDIDRAQKMIIKGAPLRL